MNDTVQTTEDKAPKAPRGPSPENQARLNHILSRTAEEPGISSPTLARELGITTLTCSQLTDRLVRQGSLRIFKIAGGVRTNYPADYDMEAVAAAHAEAEAAAAQTKAEAKAAAAQAKADAAAAAATEEPTGEQ